MVYNGTLPVKGLLEFPTPSLSFLLPLRLALQLYVPSLTSSSLLIYLYLIQRVGLPSL